MDLSRTDKLILGCLNQDTRPAFPSTFQFDDVSEYEDEVICLLPVSAAHLLLQIGLNLVYQTEAQKNLIDSLARHTAKTPDKKFLDLLNIQFDALRCQFLAIAREELLLGKNVDNVTNYSIKPLAGWYFTIIKHYSPKWKPSGYGDLLITGLQSDGKIH